MAPRGQKRNATDTKKGAVKKTRTDAAEDIVLMAIVETIEQAETLPATCRSMLITGVRSSLSTPSDERHEVQTLIVGMVDEVIAARETSLEEALASAKTAEANTEVVKAELATKLSHAEAGLADKSKLLEEKTLANGGALEQMTAAKSLHAEKKSLQKTGDNAMVEIQQNKAAIESAIEKDLKAILEGQADCQDILALLQKLSFDESLIKALPATCGRGTADRGAFDGMVLSQLETSLAQKLKDLSNQVEAQVPAAKAREEAVEAAQGHALAARSLQEKATDEQASAEASRNEASVAVEAAVAALAAHESQERNTVTLREEKSAMLEAFRLNTRVPFEVLRDAKASMVVEVASPDAKVTTVETDASATVTVGGA